jgi:zinc protease
MRRYGFGVMGIISAACLAGCALPASRSSETAPEALPPLPDIAIPYTDHRLPNGLRVIVHEDRKAPIVAVNVWYHVGSKDERPGRTGFAHLFEHLMYKGTAHYDGDPFQLLEPIGATKMNGTTWYDRTNYFQNVPTGALDLALWLESERMGHLLPVLSEQKLEEERGIVLNEKREGENRPYGKVFEIIAAKTWPAGHPYSWTTIGSYDDLNAATLEDVKTWFETHYGAANATLVIAGDVDTATALEKAAHYFGDIPPGPPRDRPEAWVAKREGSSRHTTQDRVPQARQLKVWNVPGYCEADHTALQLVAEVFASGKNTPLHDRLVHETQLATSANAYLLPTEIASQFILDVTVSPGRELAEAEALAVQTLQRFLEQGPSDADLERARTTLFAGAVRGLERIDGYSGKAQSLAQSAVYCGSPAHIETWLDRVRAATPKSVRDAARRWLSDGDFTLTVTPFPETQVADSGADRSQPPGVAEADPLKLPSLEHFTLSNGLRVALAHRDSAPVVQFTLLFEAGLAADQQHAPGTAALTLALMGEGAGERDALALAAEASRLGAEIGTGNSLDHSYVSLNALSSRLGPSLALYADVVRRPRMEAADFERLRRRTLAAIAQEDATPTSLANRSWAVALFGEGHPYALPGSSRGTAEAVAALSLDDLQDFRSTWLRPDRAQLLVVGDTDRDTLLPLLEGAFGDWQPPAAAAPRLRITEVPPPQAPRVRMLHRADAEQTVLLVAALAPPVRDARSLPLEVANTALGGSFSARLNQRLRVEKNWSYGAYSGVRNAIGPRAWVASSAVQADRSAEALIELVGLLREPGGKRPLTADEIDYAIGNLTRALPGDNETTAEIARSLLFPIAYGVEADYWDRYVPAVQAVDADEANAALQALGLPERAVYVIVGDLARIEAPVRAALRRLGLGEPEIVHRP